jgi:hypothetical protein
MRLIAGKRTTAASDITDARHFDFDHLRAKISHDLGAKWASNSFA